MYRVCERHLSTTLYRNAELIQEPSEASAHRTRPSPLNVRALLILKRTSRAHKASSPQPLAPLQKLPVASFLGGRVVCDRWIMEIPLKCCVLASSPRSSTDYFSFKSSAGVKLFIFPDSLAACFWPTLLWDDLNDKKLFVCNQKVSILHYLVESLIWKNKQRTLVRTDNVYLKQL